MKVSNLIRLSAMAGAFALVATSHALIYSVSANLDGLQETPPNASPASGFATGSYDTTTLQITLDVQATGFVGSLTAGHIHQAPIGVAGPVIVPLANMMGGTVWHSNGVYALTALQGADLIAGGLYVNLHTQVFPGGEVRGQLIATPVPEPAPLAALAFGTVALVARRRRKS